MGGGGGVGSQFGLSSRVIVTFTVERVKCLGSQGVYALKTGLGEISPIIFPPFSPFTTFQQLNILFKRKWKKFIIFLKKGTLRSDPTCSCNSVACLLCEHNILPAFVIGSLRLSVLSVSPLSSTRTYRYLAVYMKKPPINISFKRL